MYFNSKRVLIITIVVMSILALFTVAIWAFSSDNESNGGDVTPTITTQPTVTPTILPSVTEVLEPTLIPTIITMEPTQEVKPTRVIDPTVTVTPTATEVPIVTEIVTDVPIITAEPTQEVKPTATSTVTPVPTVVATATPKPTKVPKPTATMAPTKVPKPTEVPEPTETPEPTKTADPTPTPKPTKTPDPTATPKPTKAPSQDYVLPEDERVEESLGVSLSLYNQDNLPASFKTEEELVEWLADRNCRLDMKPDFDKYGFKQVGEKKLVYFREADPWNVYWYEFTFAKDNYTFVITIGENGMNYTFGLDAQDKFLVVNLKMYYKDEMYHEFDANKNSWPKEGLGRYLKNTQK